MRHCVTPPCATDALLILSSSGISRNCRGSRAVPGLCPGACPLPWEADAHQCLLSHSSQGGAGKSGHSREGLQFCHLQKGLYGFDVLGQWQVSKALGILESLILLSYGKQGICHLSLLTDDVSSQVLPASHCSCKPVLVLCCPEIFVEIIAEMWSCAKLCNTEMEQAGAFPFPTMV